MTTKKYVRKAGVSRRYGVHDRSVDRWSLDGRLPKPIYKGRIPLWDEAELDALDRAATVKANQR
jgi:predicted DNA-binding transcriptional regulator AlpA